MTSVETNLSLQLPVTDFTSRDLEPGTAEWDSVKGKVRQALEEYGCFKALFDKLSLELRKAGFKASEELFQLPLETKQRTESEMKYRGYVGQNPTNPLYQGMGIDVADNPEKVNEFTQKLWPQGNTSFRSNYRGSMGFWSVFCTETVLSLTKHVSKLDSKIRRMVMESFCLDENYIEEHLKFTKCLMRMMKYRGFDETEEELSMEAHNDVGDGLEVKTKGLTVAS